MLFTCISIIDPSNLRSRINDFSLNYENKALLMLAGARRTVIRLGTGTVCLPPICDEITHGGGNAIDE